MLQLYVRCPGAAAADAPAGAGGLVAVELHADATVHDVAVALEDQTGLSPAEHALVLGDCPLEPATPLADAGVGAEATIDCARRPSCRYELWSASDGGGPLRSAQLGAQLRQAPPTTLRASCGHLFCVVCAPVVV